MNAARLTGKVFVFTGEMPTIPRHDAMDMVRAEGGSVQYSVTREASYLVIGEVPGSRLQQAQRLGVTVIDEDAFVSLFEVAGATA